MFLIYSFKVWQIPWHSALYGKFYFYDWIPWFHLLFLHHGNHRALPITHFEVFDSVCLVWHSKPSELTTLTTFCSNVHIRTFDSECLIWPSLYLDKILFNKMLEQQLFLCSFLLVFISHDFSGSSLKVTSLEAQMIWGFYYLWHAVH